MVSHTPWRQNTTTFKYANTAGTDFHYLCSRSMPGANHWNAFAEEQIYSQLSMWTLVNKPQVFLYKDRAFSYCSSI